MAHPPKRRPRHRAADSRHSSVRVSVTSAALAASIATGVGAGLAHAVPEQGGTSPSDTAPQQGGTTPAPSPGTPEQGGTTPIPETAPVYAPGPGSLPAPPQEAPYQPYVAPSTYTAPTYDDEYEAAPIQALRAPGPAAPVRPIAPPPNKIRIGNYITDIPDEDVNSINAWAAYGEAKIAQGLISMGVPEDEASRQAAATIIGVASGGAAGAAAVGIPAAATGAAVGAVVGIPVGAVVGAIYNGVTFSGLLAIPGVGWEPWLGMVGLGAGAGALIGIPVGAAVGAAALGAAGAVAGAVAGGTAGGALAYALGAGDPGANPDEPWKQGDAESLPNPQANQFELTLPADKAQQAGLPSVDFTVNMRGDVSLQIGSLETGWSAEQALAPYRALGIVGAQQEQNARAATKQNAPMVEQVIPGMQITWPQEVAPTSDPPTV
ncbi:hypothetical protein [Gordonia rhizosphera]|uniref:Uncharacterized protein n=1 Tax=Gordonia rhizosphera NBRC 16068 TaxID=1108045 RepID=K6WSG8_9ACTN|nr:hypothetical protein [Gordonia rhizosphera]GAB89509.1 hypothetical protein GORHZ_063_00030 [Gordonia rhizosphera NBRC 16068]